MQRSDHAVTTSDGAAVPFHLYAETGRDAVVIVCPGFFQSKEAPTFQRLACAVAAECDAVCLDFRGHGRSRRLFTFSAREWMDLEAVVEWAQARYARIGLLGFSLGAATSLTAAARLRVVKTVIAVSAPSTFEEIEFQWWTPEAIRTGWRGMEPGSGCRPGFPWMKKPRPIDAVEPLSPTPVLFIHGTSDPIVSHRHSERLYARASAPKRLELIEEGGHAEELYRRSPGRFLSLVQGWIRSTLISPDRETQAVPQESGYVDVRPGTALYYQHWGPRDRGSPLVIVHGAGEHSGRYAETARRLAQAGFAVWAFDLEGHGRSPGVRGHIRRFGDYLTDLAAFIRFVSQQHGGALPVLLGHSLGGMIATHYAAVHGNTIRALVLSSPLWGLRARIPLWKHLLAYGLSGIWPSLTLRRPRTLELVISHDPAVTERYLTDPLMHFVASARFYVEMRRAEAELPQRLPQVSVPVLILQAGDERIASAEAAQRLFPLVGASDKRLIVYDGYYHEVLNEVGRDRVVQDLLDWLRVRGLP